MSWMPNHPNLNDTTKKELLIIHGALGAQDQFVTLANELNNHYKVHLIDLPGHGGNLVKGYDFSIPSFADYVIDYCVKKNLVSPSVFGYSMGGFVAMYIAKNYKGKLNRIITLATKYHWDENTALKESKMHDAEVIREKVPVFAKQLETRHGKMEWISLLHQTKNLLYTLGHINFISAEESSQIKNPCLLILGDRDKMVTMDETVSVYRNLPDGQLAILPGTPHPIEQVDPSLLSMFIHRFLSA